MFDISLSLRVADFSRLLFISDWSLVRGAEDDSITNDYFLLYLTGVLCNWENWCRKLGLGTLYFSSIMGLLMIAAVSGGDVSIYFLTATLDVSLLPSILYSGVIFLALYAYTAYSVCFGLDLLYV